MKYFVTTVGWRDIWIIASKRRGEFAGRFLLDDRCVGYFDTEEEALECILENLGDIYECGGYPYAVIERFEAGLYPIDHAGSERFFWWYGGGYREIGRPHWGKQTCNWGIG